MKKLAICIVFFFLLSLSRQSAYAQIKLAGFITTIGTADSFPTHIDSLQKGGYRIAKDTVERNGITSQRRKIGMLVYAQNIDSMYILKGGIANSNWVVYSSGGAGGAAGTATSAATPGTIVLRNNTDGGFSAGAITATLNGNAATATFATTAGTLNQPAQTEITSVGTLTGLTVTNPIVGSITGTAANATNAAHATLADNAVNVTGTVAIANGGTGANSVNAAKTNLALDHVTNTADSVKPVSAPQQAALLLKEDAGNKSTNTALGPNDDYFPTQNAVKTYVDAAVISGSPDATASVKGKVQLAGDLSGGTAALPQVSSVGGLIASDIAKGVALAILATDQTTGSTIVKRDILGNFSANSITATLNGNAATASNAGFATTAGSAATAGNVSGIVAVANGGTGASAAPAALINLGLGNVNNTSDANKPISTAQQAALNLKVSTSAVGAASGVASLGSDGKVPTSQIPPISFTSVQVVASQAAMLALTAVNGSMVIRTDNSTNYVLAAQPPSTLGNWVQLVSTGSTIQSVNGKIGTVVLTPGDLGLGSVQNTPDSSKVISNPALAALLLKEDSINKSSDINLGTNDILYPTQNAVKTYVDSKITASVVPATTSTLGTIVLAGDLGGTATVPTVLRVGGATASNIYTASNLANAATSSANGSTLVKRDASGNFSAGTITATLNGNATTATTAATATTATTAVNVSGVVALANGGTGATTAVNAKANLGMANVNNTSDLSKPISTLTQAAINLKANLSLVGTANGIASLDANGLVPTNQIPPISFTTVQVVATMADMLALSPAPLVGSVAIRTDNGTNYVLAALPGTDSTNWVKLLSTGSGVQSINGRTGTINLTPADFQLGNVQNTADIDKPISTLTQSALSGKEDLSNKSKVIVAGGSDSLYPTQNAVIGYVGSQLAAISPDATAILKGKVKLAGDLGGTADAPTVQFVGSSTAASVRTATVAANAATDQNTASTIVKRDVNGNFSAGTITATSLVGTASHAINADTALNVSGIVLPANGGTGVNTTTKAYVFAGPTGASGPPAFRALVASDMPVGYGSYLPLAGGTLTGPLIGTTASLVTLGVTGAATAATLNGLTLTAATTGFTIAGGTTSRTLVVANDASVGGTNTGDVVVAGQTYLTLIGQTLTAGLINLATQTSGLLAPASGGTGTATATQNFVFAGPATGTTAAAPVFRALVGTDLPGGSGAYIANGTVQQATSNFNISGAGVIGGALTAGATTLSATTATSLNNTPIGATTSSSGAFTTLTANGAVVFFNTVNPQGVVSISNTTVSTTSATGALLVTGGVGIGQNLNVGGAIVATGNVTAYSDIRLKKNIHILPSVSESLRNIDAVEFDRKDIKVHQIGFIAQNVQKYFPSLISVAKDSMSTLSLNYQSMTSPLLKGWQEHDEIITKQQKEIDGLKKELELLKQSQLELIKLMKSKK